MHLLCAPARAQFLFQMGDTVAVDNVTFFLLSENSCGSAKMVKTLDDTDAKA